ncbi:hypothetical protein TNCV_4807971 [Trichonephila clavipes]|nr:hypothetical protein TNCV_4807971 [Trichonephila clavipes]
MALIVAIGRTITQTRGVASKCADLELHERVDGTYYSWSFCKEYRTLCTRTCGSCMMEHKHIFGLRCVTTSMLHIPGGGLDAADLLLDLHASGPQSLGLLLPVPP